LIKQFAGPLEAWFWTSRRAAATKREARRGRPTGPAFLALQELTAAAEAKIVALFKRTVGED